MRVSDELEAKRNVFGEGRGFGKGEIMNASLEAKRVRRRISGNGINRGCVRRREYRTGGS